MSTAVATRKTAVRPSAPASQAWVAVPIPRRELWLLLRSPGDCPDGFMVLGTVSAARRLARRPCLSLHEPADVIAFVFLARTANGSLMPTACADRAEADTWPGRATAPVAVRLPLPCAPESARA
jgi:hypothetical protein